MKRLMSQIMVPVAMSAAGIAACWVNGPAKECEPTLPYQGGTCNYVHGLRPWISRAAPNVSGRDDWYVPDTLWCAYDCPHLQGKTVWAYTGAVTRGNPCVGVTGTGQTTGN